LFENTIDGAVRWQWRTGFVQFPLDGRNTELGKTLRFKSLADLDDTASFVIVDTIGLGMRCMRL
jgi:hypothetical protein